MKSVNTDSSDFEQIREKGQVYVDKTAYLHRMITDSCGSLFFISRPRRFGKSLMISTLKAIFQGKRSLFENLAIARTDYDWAVHPVIHLNLGFCASDKYERFIADLPVEIARALSEIGWQYNHDISYAANLGAAIDMLYARGQAPVILIDEYDDPVAKVLDEPAIAASVRGDLASIYGQFKDRSGKIRFLMITGVSKFTKMSIFSVLSSLNDISFSDEYAAMLGFTDDELTAFYSEHVAAHAGVMDLTTEDYRNELRRMYNGYRFWKMKGDYVYNPVSINLNFANLPQRFECYWADTGRPSMLMKYLAREEVLAIDPENAGVASSWDFDVTDLASIPVKGLLYQTGYLTIKGYDPLLRCFDLGVPDEEVREDFAALMASLCAKKSVAWAASLGVQMLRFQWDEFFQGLKALYAGVAYGPREQRVCEHSYGRCLAFLLQGQGVVCQPEVTQADGRVDMVCTHPCGIFIFELKVDKPAAIAMDQMEQKKYAAPYGADSRPIWLVGLSFDSRTRMLAGCEKKKYK